MTLRTRYSSALLAFAVVALIYSPGIAAAITVTDSDGRLVTLEQPAERIIALAPHIVENLYSAGAGGRIVAAVDYSDYPQQARRLPRVGGVGTLSLEKIVSLQPDLIVLWGSGTPAGLRSSIDRLGIPYFVDEIRSLRELRQSIHALGTLAGQRPEFLEQVTAPLDVALTKPRIDASARDAEALPVFLQLWDEPLQSIGADHLLTEVIDRCQGRSITAASSGLAPQVSLEYVLAADPALIVSESNSQAAHWQRYSQLRAVRSGRILIINPDLLHRPTLRLLAGMEKLCAAIEAAARSNEL